MQLFSTNISLCVRVLKFVAKDNGGYSLAVILVCAIRPIQGGKSRIYYSGTNFLHLIYLNFSNYIRISCLL